MEFHVNAENKDIQQIDQNQSPLVPEERRSSYWMTLAVLLLALFFILVLFCFFEYSQQREVVDNSQISAPTTEVVESPLITTPVKSQGIIFPFVREASIYLYEDGVERLLISPSHETTHNSCFNVVYPMISPNKKYVAFIEQVGDEPNLAGCLEGVLKFVNLESGKVITTNYKTYYFSWNSQNQIELESTNYAATADNQGIDPSRSTTKFIIYDPSNQKEVVSDIMKYSDRDEGIRGFPLYGIEKKIRFRDGKYYLVNSNNTETYLFDKNLAENFKGFSPDGKFAIFTATKQIPQNFQAFSSIWYAVNTDNLSEVKKEILVLQGAAGGSISTGLKWLFNDAFISYCSQHLSFVDGRQPLELTNDGGGGCHNEEGFVSTSPNGDFAFLKFKDHFELRSKDGDIRRVVETIPLAKGRGVPQNLIWLDDDNMVIFQSSYGGETIYSDSPSIYIFERSTNAIRMLVQNGYLIETFR